MYVKSRSGQFVYFSMVSALSGNPVYSGSPTSLSGKISGYVSIDGAAQAAVGGFITEDGFGQYHLNGYVADFAGNNLGFLFVTSSGVVPASICATTTANVSGQIFPNSGLAVNLLSGNVTNPYSGSMSGQLVGIYSGQLSGQFVTPQSGQTFIASGSITSGVISSGVFVQSVPVSGLVYLASGSVLTTSGQLSGQLVTANVVQWLAAAPNSLNQGRVDSAFSIRTNTARSGTASTIQLDAGAPTGTSGVYDGECITLVGGTGNGQARTIQNYGSSGILTVFPAWITSPDNTSVFTIIPTGQALSGSTFLSSGQAVSVNSGQLSGQVVNLLSGNQVGVWSGTQVNVFSGQLSGQVVTAASGAFGTASLNSGQLVVPASGTLSGQLVGIYSGQLSGQVMTPQSGQTFIASGSVTSGVICSGVYVTASVSIASGTIYLASGSITSGVIASGVFVTAGVVSISSGLLSGQIVTPASGTDYLASGSVFKNTFASGMLAVEIPYGILKADFSGVTGEAARSLINANRKLIDKWDTTTNSGKLTVFKEDDTTQAYTQNLTTQSGANPIVSLKTN